MNKDRADNIRFKLADLLEVDESRITPETRLREDLGCDSLDMYEFRYFLEAKFGIEIPDDLAASVKTVQDFIDWYDIKYKGE